MSLTNLSLLTVTSDPSIVVYSLKPLRAYSFYFPSLTYLIKSVASRFFKSFKVDKKFLDRLSLREYIIVLQSSSPLKKNINFIENWYYLFINCFMKFLRDSNQLRLLLQFKWKVYQYFLLIIQE